MTHLPLSPVTATDEMVERAWAAIVGSDIAAQCYQASIIRADLKTALEAVLGHAQYSKEPAAYLHTLHMDLGQTERKLMWTEPSPFGIPGKHYDATYMVSCTPLFAVTDTSTPQKSGEFKSDVDLSEATRSVASLYERARGASASGGSSHIPADSSPVRCQVCGEPADLTCGPSRFGDKTWACKDCWEPDCSPIRETGK